MKGRVRVMVRARFRARVRVGVRVRVRLRFRVRVGVRVSPRPPPPATVGLQPRVTEGRDRGGRGSTGYTPWQGSPGSAGLEPKRHHMAWGPR